MLILDNVTDMDDATDGVLHYDGLFAVAFIIGVACVMDDDVVD